MKGGDGIFSNILIKSRSSKLFKKRPPVQSTTRTTATTTLQDGRAQSIDGSDSTLSSVHTGSMTGYAGNLSSPVIIPLHVLMHEDADADSVSLVTARDRSRRSIRSENGGLFKKATTKKKTNSLANGRRRQATKCGDEAGCECKTHHERRPTTNRKKMTRRRKSVQKRSSSRHSSTVPSTETRQDNGIGKTSINITRMDSSNDSAVECMFTDAFTIDTFRNGGSICSSGSSCSTDSGDEE